jgi:hypothetical protein
VGEAPAMPNSSPSKLALWMEYSSADLDKSESARHAFPVFSFFTSPLFAIGCEVKNIYCDHHIHGRSKYCYYSL